MDTNESDYSLPPQWILDLYDADKMPPHILVKAGEEAGTYLIEEVDFHGIDLFAVSLREDIELPTKGETRVFKGSAEELYEELSKDEEKVILDPSVNKEFRGKHRIPMVFGHPFEFLAPAALASTYRAFRKTEAAYVANPDDSVAAYEFINNHPVFWHKRVSRRDDTKFDIITDRGWNRLDFMVSNKPNKETGWKSTVMIECGPGNYHDYNLDVYAPSFDAALIQLASLIHKHYDSHGGFTDKTKKEPNDNFFREADKEAEEESASSKQ